MATPALLDPGSKLAGRALACAVMLWMLAGCGHKQQSTLPPVPPTPVATSHAATDSSKPAAPPDTSVDQPPLKSGWIYKASVNVRSGPSTTAPIISRLTRGSEVKLLDKTDQWWRIKLDDTLTAYIHESMVSPDRFVDPWTQFKLGGRLADTTLQIITAVTELKDSQSPSAGLTVADSWSTYSKIRKQRVAQAAFAYWKICLTKAGIDSRNTAVILRDEEGVDLVRVTGSADKTTVEFLK
jgi:hypothetical protein